jgi:cytochrome c oxidase assembly factor CtaG
MITKYPKIVMSIVILFALVNIVVAADAAQNMRNALGAVCDMAKGLLALVALVLIVLAAIIYGLGQVLGAETRARATVWATAMFTGAIIGGIIWIVMPWIVSIMMTGTADSDWVNRCCVKEPTEDCSGFTGGDAGNNAQY